MSNWPLQEATQTETVGLDLAASTAIVLPTLSAANTWTAWTQLVAATARAAEGFTLLVTNAQTTGRAGVIELAIGSAGNEVPIAGPFSIDITATVAMDSTTLYVPVALPAGVRVAARWRATATATAGLYTPNVTVALAAPTGMTPVGFAPTTLTAGLTLSGSETNGTTIDAGGTVHTEGARVEISAALPRSVRGFFVNLATPTSGGGGRHSGIVFVNVGAAGSEQRVAAVPYRPDVGTHMAPRCAGPYFVPIAAGTRVSLSSQYSNTGTPARLVSCWLTFF